MSQPTDFEQSDEGDSKLSRIVSSTGDGASTQIKLNHLIQAESGREVIENKCSMHLGVNLRKAQVKALSQVKPAQLLDILLEEDENQDESNIMDTDNENVSNSDDGSSESDDDANSDTDSDTCSSFYDDHSDTDNIVADADLCKKPARGARLQNDIDQFVHEVSKLFGHLGTPEYCTGSSEFRIFLEKESRKLDNTDLSYYCYAKQVRLKRQVGSRYYVTSSNAGVIFFLSKAMVTFLNERKQLKKLNQLESTCLQKLTNVDLLTKACLEGLMYDHVYADLMMLVKSNVLMKSSFHMNVHYGELVVFLESLTENPSLILESTSCVFTSEIRLYGNDKMVNHRLRKNYIPIRESLFEPNSIPIPINKQLLFDLIKVVGEAVVQKLKSYKKDHLPGGRYFSPDEKTREVLSSLEPHNDLSESVFGKNDWLTVILPNMSQTTKTTLIEFSYNKTMKWLKEQGESQKKILISLAQGRRKAVLQERMQEKEDLMMQKIQSRAKSLEKAEQKQKKNEEMIVTLKLEILITSQAQLNQLVDDIQNLSLPRSLQDAEIRSLVKKQILVRSHVYNQSVNIYFTHQGVTKSNDEILQELSQIIIQNPIRQTVSNTVVNKLNQQLSDVFDKPTLLTGVKVRHRFEVDGQEEWFTGQIDGYRKGKFTISYDAEVCQFSMDEIKDDYFNGDFWIT